jgi:hypothetical protein
MAKYKIEITIWWKVRVRYTAKLYKSRWPLRWVCQDTKESPLAYSEDVFSWQKEYSIPDNRVKFRHAHT